VRGHLERLQSALGEGDLSGSSNLLQELRKLNLPDDCRALFARLEEFIDGYEYDQAAEAVHQLLARFSPGETS
jgi:hypothetical protein